MNQNRSDEKIVIKYVKKIHMFKWTYVLSDNDYRVAPLSQSCLTVTGIILTSLSNCHIKKTIPKCLSFT